MFSSMSRKLCINCTPSSCIPKNNVLKNLVHNEAQEPRFGILFDIDGVIVREKKVLPCATEAFSRLVQDGKFKVPTVFVTNAGNALRTQKAQQLSEWLDVNVREKVACFLEKIQHHYSGSSSNLWNNLAPPSVGTQPVCWPDVECVPPEEGGQV